jgi:glucose/arabinose dehydrogenase
MRTQLLFASLLLATASHAQTVQLALVPWAEGLEAAVDVANCGDDRLFVVRQNGLISIVTDSMTVLPTPFLDLTGAVVFAGEQGLLGMAFDPGYATNGIFYVNYVSAVGGPHSRISRFTVSSDANVADPTSEEIIYMVDQPYTNHNGGDLEFGPDGYLYIAWGDGGGAGDPDGNAQDLSDPLGDIIRIDVSDTSVPYAVPADNPYVGVAGIAPEIWSSGLRNPYRFGFDRANGDMWIGDVGQGEWEEVDHVVAGGGGGENFGWRCYEGFEPYDLTGCEAAEEYDAPVVVQYNGGNGWCAVIGGRVYRGAQYPALTGYYIYTDFCLGEFWTISQPTPGEYLNEGALTSNTISGWSGIGEDAAGELYATNLNTGMLYKIVDACPMEQPTITFVDGDLVSSPAAAYQWYLNGQLIDGATDQVYTPVANGEYIVVADMINGCSLKSDVYTLLTTGMGTANAYPPLLQPNPANEYLVITCPQESALRSLRVVDMQGREVVPSITLNGVRTTLSTAALPAGHYVVQFTDGVGNAVFMQRFAVVH